MTIALRDTDFATQTKVKRNFKNECIVFAYQDLANMGYYAAGVLNTLNHYLDEPLQKSEIKLFLKTSPIIYPKLETIGAGISVMSGPELSQRAFKKLLTLNSSAMRSLKVYCCNNPIQQQLTDQEVAKLKEKWVEVTKQILVCLFELRAMSASHNAGRVQSTDIPHTPLEERLIAARSGLSI